MADKPKEGQPWYQPISRIIDTILTPTPKKSGVTQSSAGPLGSQATREARRDPLTAVTRARIAPDEASDASGRRIGRAPAMENFWGTFGSNIHPIDSGVSLAKSLARPQDLAQIDPLVKAWTRGSIIWQRKANFDNYKRSHPNVPDDRNPYSISNEWYSGLYRTTSAPVATAAGEPVPVNIPGYDFTRKDPKTGRMVEDGAAIREQVLRDMYTAGIIANHYSSVNPRTGRSEWDWNAVQRTIAENPIDAILAVTPLVEAGGVKTATQLGRIFKATAAADKATGAIRGAARATRMAVNPVGEVALPAAARAGSVAMTRTVGRGAEVLNPEYVSAFNAFKRDGVDELVSNGMSRRDAMRTVNDPANQDQIFLRFNQENRNRWLNPYNDATTRAMQETTVGPRGETTIDPTVLGLPSHQEIVSKTVSRRGGISGPVLREAVSRASGAPSVTRSMTTGESPGYLWDIRGGEEQARAAARSAAGTAAAVPAPGEMLETGTIGNYRFNPESGWVVAGSGRPVSDPSTGAYLNEIWKGRQQASPLAQYGAEIAMSPYSTQKPIRSLARRAYGTIAPQLGGLAGIGYFLQGIPGAVAGLGAEAVKEAGSAAVGAMGLRDRFGAPTVMDPSAWYAKSEGLVNRLRQPSPPPSLQLAMPAISGVSGAAGVMERPLPSSLTGQAQAEPKPVTPPAAKPVTITPVQAPKVWEQPRRQGAPDIDLSGYGFQPTPQGSQGEDQEIDLSGYGFTPRNEGGRVAYRNGGKVSGIEPLVQALMRKYKQARSMEGKSTEGLLDTPDQAIVKALSVAKKAI